MNLLVLGATGATGKLVVEQALSSGHDVRALVRSPEKLTLSHPNLTVVTGQATDPGDVGQAMRSIDAVIIVLGSTKGTVITDATRAVLNGAREYGVKRVVMLSSFAVQRDGLSSPAKILTGLTMAAMLKDKATAEDLLRHSDLDYTIVYATRLGKGPASGRSKTVNDSTKLTLGDQISRADVATWLLDAIVNDSHSRSSVAITS
jgi:uncharacterized protein YbjT (DUF2867 family)